ncbi:hypothetical protein ABEDC_1739 [Acinetobacter lwoffii]|jgi:hypothetical protein|nr:hypothetical protein ABEDC_1739 [Acinetobacter lwoffii]GEA65708.1 hypothetical protein AL1T_29860 [Acinetobacter lwoffii]
MGNRLVCCISELSHLKKHCRLIGSVLCFAKLIDALPEFQIRIEELLSQVLKELEESRI